MTLRNLWDAMWPNMFAPSVITLAAVAVSHVRHARAARRRHQDLKAHVGQMVADAQGSAGAGSNPAQGLTADQPPTADAPGAERVVPPAATVYINMDPADPDHARQFDIWFRSYLRRHGIGRGLM